MYKALRIFFIAFGISGLAISQVSDEEFILNNIEMLEALEMLETDISLEKLDTELEEELEKEHES